MHGPPVPPPPGDIDEARRRLLDTLRDLAPGAVVALSGGADSALLVHAAARAWGRAHVVAVTSRSESLAAEELETACDVARRAGVEHVVVRSSELDIEAFRRNAPDRCFHCKDHLYGQLREVARERGLSNVLDGSNADDVGDHRPGMAAARRHGVRSPLLEAGLTKSWVRALSREMGLPTWDKPPEACLSSRFPYGTEVTREGLQRVAAAERAIRREGFSVVRVRVHGTVARIEVPLTDLAAALSAGVRERIVEGVRAAGFDYVSFDAEGYRSGSLNESLGRGPTTRDASR